MHIDLGDLPTWIASVGTVSAVSLALWQSRREQREQRKVSHREHAARISASISMIEDGRNGSDITIMMINASQEPIYEVVVFQVFIQGTAPQSGEQWIKMAVREARESRYIQTPNAVIMSLPPGQYETTFVERDTGIMMSKPVAEIAFVDRNGTSWIRRPSGDLEQIDKRPIDHYGIERPVTYIPPRRTE